MKRNQELVKTNEELVVKNRELNESNQDLRDKNYKLLFKVGMAISAMHDVEVIIKRAKGVQQVVEKTSANDSSALLLVDGDHYIFHEDFLRRGRGGGELAAKFLKAEASGFFYHNGFEGSDSWKIFARIYMDLEGLASKLVGAKYVPNVQTVFEFMIGFTNGQSLFEAIDSGDSTAEKFNTKFDLSISDINCKHILVGYSYKAGYPQLLDQYNNNPLFKDRISLLVTQTMRGGFIDMAFRKLDVPYLFIADRL